MVALVTGERAALIEAAIASAVDQVKQSTVIAYEDDFQKEILIKKIAERVAELYGRFLPQNFSFAGKVRLFKKMLAYNIEKTLDTADPKASLNLRLFTLEVPEQRLAALLSFCEIKGKNYFPKNKMISLTLKPHRKELAIQLDLLIPK